MAPNARKRKQIEKAFVAEARIAALYRSYGRRADADGLPNLARHWRSLAAAKDDLAVGLIEAVRPSLGGAEDLEAAIDAEQQENEAFYPEMMVRLDGDYSPLLEQVVEAQRQHLAWMQALLGALDAARGDVEAPVDSGSR